MSADVALLAARIDRLTQALLHLAGELWAARDRQAVLEHLLAAEGIAAPGHIDRFTPEPALAAALEREREAFVAGILACLAPEG